MMSASGGGERPRQEGVNVAPALRFSGERRGHGGGCGILFAATRGHHATDAPPPRTLLVAELLPAHLPSLTPYPYHRIKKPSPPPHYRPFVTQQPPRHRTVASPPCRHADSIRPHPRRNRTKIPPILSSYAGIRLAAPPAPRRRNRRAATGPPPLRHPGSTPPQNVGPYAATSPPPSLRRHSTTAHPRSTLTSSRSCNRCSPSLHQRTVAA